MTKHSPWLLMLVLLSATGCPDSDLAGRDPLLWDGYKNPFRDIERMDHGSDLDAVSDATPDEIGPQACLGDADCPEGLYCDPKSSVCVECYRPDQCRPGELCMDGKCVELPTCGPQEECPEGSYCLDAMGVCVSCIVDEHCPADYICEKYECLPRPPCDTDEDCPPPMVCSPHLGVCVECLNDTHCTLDQWCEIDLGICDPDVCKPGAIDCVAGGFMVCKENGSGFGELVPCPEGTYCNEGQCLPIEVCVPGESLCLGTMALKECNQQGTAWETRQCLPDETCVDLGQSHAVCKSGCLDWCDAYPPETCGPDGCGGYCNKCLDGQACDPMVWTLSEPKPLPCIGSCTCEGKECGDNGCGESCGECGPSQQCQAGVCTYVGTTCAESWQCVIECSLITSSGMIPPGCFQTCIDKTRPQDQGKFIDLLTCAINLCGGEMSNLACMEEAISGPCRERYELCMTCQPDCVGKSCGDDGCGATCGSCGAGYQCNDGICVGSGSCASILTCLTTDDATAPVPVTWCVQQAKPEAQAVFYELYNCVMEMCDSFMPQGDCYVEAINTMCAETHKKCLSCQPNCWGNQCGPDGCGGYCGTCPTGWSCEDQKCICKPNCLGKQCGADGCGGICGVCQSGFQCDFSGQCTCLKNCVGKECGPDGCNGSCGVCPPNSQCTDNGSCLPFLCNPGDLDCDGNMRLVCPEDGNAWVPLGECENGTWCVSGLCKPWVCTPGEKRCEGNGVAECAQNGAGWLPPVLCPSGTVCNGGICVPTSGCGDIPSAGCCDGTKAVLCLNGTITVKECGTLGCGWMPTGSYGCGGNGPDPTGLFPLTCPGTCHPECDAKECGGDGCGGSCGSCPLGWACEDGACVNTCIPNCTGKACGQDGCGGICGLCAPSEECQGNTCVRPKNCGEMVVCAKGCFSQGSSCGINCASGSSGAELTEFYTLWQCVESICPAGSAATCFDQAVLGTCYTKYLACISCTPSCDGKVCGPDGCGGSCGQCDPASQCTSGQCVPICLPNCSGKECGSNGCGGSCGLCLAGYECINNKCVWPCQPLCTGKQCGNDGCGGSCGSCPSGTLCSPDGLCQPLTVCGDGICDSASESCSTCSLDCGTCTNGCTPSPLPGCNNCSCQSCVCQKLPECCSSNWGPQCVDACKACGGCGCTPSCAGKTCGPDGCGGSCGTCPAGNTCQNGVCIASCVPNCTGKTCGSNGCGGTCGTCPTGETCVDSQCFQGLPCTELIDCTLGCVSSSGSACLFDCMNQGTPEARTKFMSLAQCVLQACTGYLTQECFITAMKGQCITEYYQCTECAPSCAGKKCGPDGCGGSCGTCPAGTSCENYQCVGSCVPNCANKMCGSDGCGGSCGSCPAGTSCNTSGLCQPTCVPNCTGKQCGSDGCGGSCGSCPAGTTCSSTNMCIPSGPVCGDGVCTTAVGESCSNCPKDCGTCGNGCSTTSAPGCGGCSCEACVCQKDPYCCQVQWDDLCVQACVECGGCGCLPKCTGKECGDDGCGGSCGTCKPGAQCYNGKCSTTCVPNCTAKQCGSNGCGGSCGMCPEGFVCSAQGTCKPSCVPNCTGKECGPDGCNGLCGLCGPDEACLSGTCIIAWDCNELLNCSWDCPANDDACWNACWQNASPDAQQQFITVWQCVIEVCGQEPQDPCIGNAVYFGECKDEFNSCLNCTPACTGKQCGPDGCNGSCGNCPTGYTCDEFGYCDCTPNCSGQECGNDGCNGSCGECSPGYLCSQYGKCTCVPQCTGAQCGSDGCGGVCGTCQTGYTCQNKQCVPSCTPQCWGKQCGPDGCGGQCGYCPPGLTCSFDGQCTTVGPVCGDTKCDLAQGESCATCPKDCGQCTGDCCTVQGQPGCGDPDVMSCVCAQDPYCCQAMWDDICVSEVTSFGCGKCGCVPQCSGKQCGSDGCGGTCGTCPVGSTCNALGQCSGTCLPNCTGKSCGGDGCGGSCGTCPPNSTCNALGACIPVCQPQCNGKQCGADGCGGTCGTCPLGSACNATGQCVCVPTCTGKQCGSDGCGGSCGTCGQWQSCTASGQCAWVTPLCGDGNCSSWIQETCDSCPQDCGSCCGNGSCDGNYLESCATCPNDCGTCCGNGFCEPTYGETCTDCPSDCGVCPAKCGDNLCEADRGETCDNCPSDCGNCGPVCGDGWCQDGETCSMCPQDCGPCQGESCCIAHDSPGCQDAKVQDCVCAQDSFCCSVSWDSYCAQTADLCGSCTGNACEPHDTPGADDETVESCVCSFYPECCTDRWYDYCASGVEGFGCGTCATVGFCGDGLCASNESCDSCEPDCGPCGCIPNCSGKVCGSDGCNGSCGECPPGFTCSATGSCTPGTGGDSCADLVGCAMQCGSDWNCMMSCYNTGTPEAQSAFMELLTCAAGQCGLPPDTNCMYMAFMGACYSQYSTCLAN